MLTRLDHRRQFVERNSTAKTVRSCVDAEFVMAAATVLDVVAKLRRRRLSLV